MIPVFLMDEAYYSARILRVGLDFRLIGEHGNDETTSGVPRWSWDFWENRRT